MFRPLNQRILSNICRMQRQQCRTQLPCLFTRCSSDSSSQISATKDNTEQLPRQYKREAKPKTNFPIAKNLFLALFNVDSLVFPEVLSKSELEELNLMVQPVEKFFREDVDSKIIDEKAKIPDKILQMLKDLGMFGQQIPPEYGGLGLNATMYARIAEVTSLDASIAVTLAAHQAIGLKGILIAGTEEQKNKYLPKLATGEHVAAFALTEPSSGSDAASITTKATLSEDGKHYLLSGSKIFISNGGIADIFTVFAKTSFTSAKGEVHEKVSAFIVERAFGGITNGKPEDKLGIRGSNTCEVHFDNTPVPLDNILGKPGDGFKIAMNILNSGRFSMGSSVAGFLRKLIALTAEHAISRTQFGTKLMNFELIQEKFAKMALKCYAMESMAYMTAGILDSYEQPDAAVEAAMVKVFSSEAAWESVSECLQILGGTGYMKSNPHERYLRDSRILQIFEGTNEILRIFIALTGIEFASHEMKEIMQKVRNPLNNFGFLLKMSMERQFASKKYNLHKYVHPTLGVCAETIENKLLPFRKVVELGLSLYSQNIVNEQLYLKRLADIAILLYAMICVTARCSRSLSIGLKNADHEALLTTTFVNDASLRIDQLINELKLGKLNNGDENYKQIADAVFKNHGYCAAHPLERNW